MCERHCVGLIYSSAAVWAGTPVSSYQEVGVCLSVFTLTCHTTCLAENVWWMCIYITTDPPTLKPRIAGTLDISMQKIEDIVDSDIKMGLKV